MKIDIISGFLGAGKTTLIKKLVREQLYKERIVIIENEYGEVGIDGDLLKEHNLEIKEITSGCICCSIAGDFIKTMEAVAKEYNPERLIIEPSGVAKLSKVIGLIKSSEERSMTKVNIQAVVVDIKNFDLYITDFGEFYTNQIVNARTVILSRTQYASDQELTHVVMAIRKINPRCSIVTTPWNKLSSEKILNVCEQRLEDLMRESGHSRKSLNITHVIRNTGTSVNSEAKDVFETWSQEFSSDFTIEGIKFMLNKLKDQKLVGFVVRAKGIFKLLDGRWIKFNYIPNYIEINDIEINDIGLNCSGRVSIVGKNLNKKVISELFLSYSSD